jgi:hydroxymethylpyrimidine/phosphomethylpyrimidine kinase
MTAIALTIAGSDSSGGAGLQADLKTFSALGVYGASVVTAITAQNTRGVQAVHNIQTAMITAQMDSVFNDLTVGAVKIGMLSTAEIIETVAASLLRHKAQKIVLDPVMVATSGDLLLDPGAVGVLCKDLLPLATITTPNLPEAARMLKTSVAQTQDEMIAQAKALRTLGARAVLLKGGHGSGAECTDILATEEGIEIFTAPRIITRNSHGTGCTLAAAIAAQLALGLNLRDAVAAAKSYVTSAIGKADTLLIGHGSGPVHHFHAIW